MKKILAAALALWMTLGAAALAEGTFRVGVKQDVYGFGYYDEATGEFSGMELSWAKSSPRHWAMMRWNIRR